MFWLSKIKLLILKSKKIVFAGNRKGSSIIVALFLLSAMIILSSIVLFNITFVSKQLNKSYNKKHAFYLAEAGLEKALCELSKNNSNHSGEENIFLGGGEFNIKVLPDDLNSGIKKIISTGYYPAFDKQKNDTPKQQKAILEVLVRLRPGKKVQVLKRQEKL